MSSVYDHRAAAEIARRLVAEGKATDLADGYLAQIPNDDMAALTAALARLLISSARKDAEAEAAARPERAAPQPRPKRLRRPSPSKLAKWEAAWQAEQDAEAES